MIGFTHFPFPNIFTSISRNQWSTIQSIPKKGKNALKFFYNITSFVPFTELLAQWVWTISLYLNHTTNVISRFVTGNYLPQISCPCFHISFCIHITSYFRLWHFESPLADRRPLKVACITWTSDAEFLVGVETFPYFKKFRALLNIVSLFTKSLTYICIPHSAFSTVGFAVNFLTG